MFRTIMTIILLSLSFAPGGCAPSFANERVKGFFCQTREAAKEFGLLQAIGHNQIEAADAVNKVRGVVNLCAPYISVEAIPGKPQTEFHQGISVNLQSFTFLPEKKEMWFVYIMGAVTPGSEFNL